MALASHFTSLHSNLSLGDALSSAVATIGRLQSGSVLRLQIDDDTALIEYRIVDPNVWPRARDAEFTLGFLDGIVRAYLGQDFRPDGLVFEHTPHDGQHFQRAVGVRCIFGEPTNLLALPRHCLAVSHGALPGLGVDDAEQVPASKLSQPSAHEEGMSTFVLRLRETILKALYDGRVDQDCVAAICGLSTRALRRKLLQHGLSFRREVQHARMCEASHLLAHTGLPIGDIAWRLGYCKQADFSRAFRDVHGVPPSALRQGIGHRGWSEC
jgi:AraC-like DNA-binding protein